MRAGKDEYASIAVVLVPVRMVPCNEDPSRLTYTHQMTAFAHPPQTGMEEELFEEGAAGSPYAVFRHIMRVLREEGFRGLSPSGRAAVMRFLCDQIVETDAFKEFIGPIPSM